MFHPEDSSTDSEHSACAHIRATRTQTCATRARTRVVNFLMVERAWDLYARLVLWMLVVTEKYRRRNIREERELTEKKLLGYDAGPNIVWGDSPFARRLENYVVIGRIKNWDCRMKMICPSSVVGFFRRIGGRKKICR